MRRMYRVHESCVSCALDDASTHRIRDVLRVRAGDVGSKERVGRDLRRVRIAGRHPSSLVSVWPSPGHLGEQPKTEQSLRQRRLRPRGHARCLNDTNKACALEGMHARCQLIANSLPTHCQLKRVGNSFSPKPYPNPAESDSDALNTHTHTHTHTQGTSTYQLVAHVVWLCRHHLSDSGPSTG
jgi:hypothetical protein